MNNFVRYSSIVSFLEMLGIKCKLKTDVSGYVLDIFVPRFTSPAKRDFIKCYIKEFVVPAYIIIEVKKKFWINWPKKVSTKDMRKQSGCIKVRNRK